MRSRRWLRVGGIAVLALAITLAYLARPVDELADVLLFPHRTVREPQHQVSRFETAYFFTDSPGEVLAAVPGRKEASSFFHGIFVILPSGDGALLFQNDPEIRPHETCGLLVIQDPGAWYQQAWSTVKYRLGLSPN